MTGFRISRRTFAASALAAGGALLLPRMSRPAFAEPKSGGRFRMGVQQASVSDAIDPARNEADPAILLGWQLRNNLVEITPAGELIGELAESWEPVDGGRRWRFNLRKGITFHSGKALTSRDVVESFNHHRKEDSTSGGKGLLVSVSDIKADGPHVVEFLLTSASVNFPYYCTDFHFMICPAREGGGIDWESGDGTGGYILQEFSPGVRSLVKKSPSYWKEGRAHFDEVEMFFINDTSALTNGFRTGALDAIGRVEPKTAAFLDRMPGFRIVEGVGNRHCTLPMRIGDAPYNDENVRTALKYAIDREQWRTAVFGGRGVLGNDTPIGPLNKFVATQDEIPQRTYDPEQAKFYLKKAGMTDINIRLTSSNTPFPGAVDAAVMFKEAAQKAGLNIEIERAPDDGYWDNVWRHAPFSISHWDGGVTEDYMFKLAYTSNAAWNETGWSNERFDDLLKQAESEFDEAKRRDLYVEMQRIYHDQGASIVPVFMSHVHGVSDKVETPETISGVTSFDNQRASERWWFSA